MTGVLPKAGGSDVVRSVIAEFRAPTSRWKLRRNRSHRQLSVKTCQNRSQERLLLTFKLAPCVKTIRFLAWFDDY